MKVYPVFLIGLAKKRCIVVGGGREGQRKIEGLLECDAAVTLISPEVTGTINAWIEERRVTWIARNYIPGDLRDAFLVIAATDNSPTNVRIREEAEVEGALINVVDDPARCSFIVGSIARQGALTIAISTGGCAPALAARLRQRMQSEFGPEYAAFLELMEAVREPLAACYPDFQARRARWYALVDSNILDLLREGMPDLARQRVTEIVGEDVLRLTSV